MSTIFFVFVDNFFGFVNIFFGFVDENKQCANDHIIVRVTRPERPKGAKDEVKLARWATN